MLAIGVQLTLRPLVVSTLESGGLVLFMHSLGRACSPSLTRKSSPCIKYVYTSLSAYLISNVNQADVFSWNLLWT